MPRVLVLCGLPVCLAPTFLRTKSVPKFTGAQGQDGLDLRIARKPRTHEAAAASAAPEILIYKEAKAENASYADSVTSSSSLQANAGLCLPNG